MTENVRDMLVQTSSVSDVAKELNVDIDFVRDIAKKRKSNVLVLVGNLRTKKSKP
jgi:predicted DNA-binding ArsR family transcriptional regulator